MLWKLKYFTNVVVFLAYKVPWKWLTHYDYIAFMITAFKKDTSESYNNILVQIPHLIKVP